MTFTASNTISPIFQPRARLSRRRLGQLAGALAFGAAALFGMASGPAAAAEGPASWKEGCAYRMPSGIPGQGQSIVADYCGRLRFCQSMSDQGRDLVLMGCIGFEPSAKPSGKRS